VILALASLGRDVLVPFGPRRYDVAFEDGEGLRKVQCKAGRERNGVIQFKTSNTGPGPLRDYCDDAHFFGVYCHARGEVYLVPVADVPSRGAHLRLRPARNGQRAGVRMAAPYLIAKDVIPDCIWVPPRLPFDD